MLVPYVKEWKRIWSIRFNILTGGFGAMALAYSQMPDGWKSVVPHWVIAVLSIGTILSAGASAVSAVIDQPALGKSNDTSK